MGRGQRSLDALRPSVFQGTPAAADQSVAQPSASDPPKQPKAAPLKRVLSITGFRGIRRWVSYPGGRKTGYHCHSFFECWLAQTQMGISLKVHGQGFCSHSKSKVLVCLRFKRGDLPTFWLVVRFCEIS